MSGYFRLNSSDFIKGLVVAVLAGVLTQLAAVVNTPGFEFAMFDWNETLKIAFAAGMAYLAKNIMTDANGEIKIGRVRIG